MALSDQFREYSHVTYWVDGEVIRAMWRGRWSDLYTNHPNIKAFKQVARKQFREGNATEITAEQFNTWQTIYKG